MAIIKVVGEGNGNIATHSRTVDMYKVRRYNTLSWFQNSLNTEGSPARRASVDAMQQKTSCSAALKRRAGSLRMGLGAAVLSTTAFALEGGGS